MTRRALRLMGIAAAPVCAAALSIGAPSIRAQSTPRPISSPSPVDSVTLAAGPQYRAGDLHRFFWGNNYRTLWTTPIRVPVLNLQTYAGGLRPLKEGGGFQSRSLRMVNAAGVEYVFRGVDKVGVQTPAAYKGTIVDRMYFDQISAMQPAAAIVSVALLDAVHVLHPTAVLTVMPDDSTLGKFRTKYAGVLGMIEEHPNTPEHGTGFAGAFKVIDSDKFLKLLNSDPTQQVDARAFLTGRLMDLLLNDADRHEGQYKWAQLEDRKDAPWIPVGTDRDHALVSYEGAILAITRHGAPALLSFDNEIDTGALTFYREFDQRLLVGLERSTWDSVTRAIVTQVTDDVIDRAVQSMPAEYHSAAPGLATTLRTRRDRLPAAAQQMYAQLARFVEIHATDKADVARVERADDHSVRVTLTTPDGAAFFTRRFDASDTHEIRLYLHGGDDRAVIRGDVPESIALRIIGGDGANTLLDSSTVGGRSHTAHLYGEGVVRGLQYGPDTLFNRRPVEGDSSRSWLPMRDHGTRYRPDFDLELHRQVGIMPMIGGSRTTYGYAQRPYATRLGADVAYAPAIRSWRARATVDHRFDASRLHVTALARLSDVELLNYFGAGNASIDSGSGSDYFRVQQRQWSAQTAIAMSVGAWTELSIGPIVNYTTMSATPNRFVTRTTPYGSGLDGSSSGTFGEAGVQVAFRSATRPGANAVEPSKRFRYIVDVRASAFPTLWNVRKAFESVAATVSIRQVIPITMHPVFIVRSGVRKLFGDFPYQESAFLGGNSTLRSMDIQRYAGDASVYATSELRVRLAKVTVLLPFDLGVTGIAESGRVSVQGASPGGWHEVHGGGVWASLRDASATAALIVTTEAHHRGIQIRTGMNF